MRLTSRASSATFSFSSLLFRAVVRSLYDTVVSFFQVSGKVALCRTLLYYCSSFDIWVCDDFCFVCGCVNICNGVTQNSLSLSGRTVPPIGVSADHYRERVPRGSRGLDHRTPAKFRALRTAGGYASASRASLGADERGHGARSATHADDAQSAQSERGARGPGEAVEKLEETAISRLACRGCICRCFSRHTFALFGRGSSSMFLLFLFVSVAESSRVHMLQ